MNNKSSDNKNLLRNIIHRKVSPSQLLILMEIRDHPGRMSREIATRCHLDPSNVSHRLDYLVQAGDVICTLDTEEPAHGLACFISAGRDVIF